MTETIEKKDGKPRRTVTVINERYPYRYIIAMSAIYDYFTFDEDDL